MRPTTDEARRLELLAARHGILRQYHDIWGRPHSPSAETCREILGSMGVPVEATPHAVRADSAGERLCEPFAALAEGSEQALTLKIPASSGPVHVSARRGAQVVGVGSETPGRPPERDTLLREFLVRLDPPLPRGIHDLTLELRSESFQEVVRTRVVVSPDRGHDPLEGSRVWGINLALYGLRSDRNLGVGDLEDLGRVVAWAAELGAEFVGLLPLHALFNETPYGVSPYYPSSRLFLNPLYIALDRVPESIAPEVRALLAGARGEAARLRSVPLVDYPAVWALKRRALEACHRALGDAKTPDPRASAFRAWRRSRGPLLDTYCTYCALREHLADADGHPSPWQDWPRGYSRPDAPDVARFREDHRQAVEFHAYLQWLAEAQLEEVQSLARERGMALGLYLDLALGVDPSGADAWIFQDVLARGASAGAPPDPFSLLGQRWGVPPPIPERHRLDGYRFFLETLRNNARRSAALRIDHVMALWRLFWIPDSLPPSQGAYVEERPEDLLALLRVVSAEERCLIVGEDLGTVPPEVRRDLYASGFYAYRLLIFEKEEPEGYRAPVQYPEQALVSATTHDLPTLDGFWTGQDLEVKRSLGRYPDPQSERGDAEERQQDRQRLLEALAAEGLLPEGLTPSADVPLDRLDDLAAAAHAFLGRSPCRLLLANLDDLIGEREMQNLPGTLDEHPNWRRKYALSVDALPASHRARQIAEAIGRERPGRARSRSAPGNPRG